MTFQSGPPSVRFVTYFAIEFRIPVGILHHFTLNGDRFWWTNFSDTREARGVAKICDLIVVFCWESSSADVLLACVAVFPISLNVLGQIIDFLLNHHVCILHGTLQRIWVSGWWNIPKHWICRINAFLFDRHVCDWLRTLHRPRGRGSLLNDWRYHWRPWNRWLSWFYWKNNWFGRTFRENWYEMTI